MAKTLQDAHGHAPKIESTSALLKITLGALGVVYGDIGTSPLYTIKECFLPAHGMPVTHDNVLGILSLVFWSLTLHVMVKYLTFVMRADNHGEGGILSLLALLRPKSGERPATGLALCTFLALIGAALLYGDGMITPALSVLSSIEGLELTTPKLHKWILPITVAVLVGLFSAQKRGTAKVGAIFGPTMLIWFSTLIATGLPWIFKNPAVLGALNPMYAARFFMHHHWHGFLMLGSVVLCVTGGESLYADMGHFGRLPIRVAWYVMVYPALLINYMGQGALLLADPGAAVSPFFHLVSNWMVYPLVGIATVSTVVASQAIISGAYSLTQQAVQLGYFPRVTIVHTSGEAEGQIYVPEINNMLMVSCVALVLGFKSSSNMASAYGIAVTGTMVVTSTLFFAVARHRWHWPMWKALPLLCLFYALDFAFFSANIVKVADGGWFPLAIAFGILVMMLTWHRGRALLYETVKSATLPLSLFMDDVEKTKPQRVSGTAVFMASNPDGAPPVLLHHFRHNKVLHEQVLLLSIATSHQPEIRREERITRFRNLGRGFYQITAAYGFMQIPNVQEILVLAKKLGVETNRDDTSYYLGRETIVLAKQSKMTRWRRAMFVFLSKNARPATAFFRIPANRVIELGIQIEL
ncbi:MAG: potassium transporter Kup [Proteobacteria bacterium]|nr:MAG: potassium transporter Kup [Pseudomonadota bacterium]